MSFNGKIRTRQGKGGISKTFFVVENFRRKDNGRPANRIVLYLGTLNPIELKNILKCQKFWYSAEKHIDAAVLAKKIPSDEVQKVKDKFKEGIGLPMQNKILESNRQRIFEKYAILQNN